MKLIKKINNNFALAIDSKGKSMIVEGKGIGFQKMPCALNDMSGIARTYYNIKEQDGCLVKNIPEEAELKLIESCIAIVEEKMNVCVDRNSYDFSWLFSHLEYLLRRTKKNSETSEDNDLACNKKNCIPKIKECVDEITVLLNKKQCYLNDDEKLLLMSQVHWICSQEGESCQGVRK